MAKKGYEGIGMNGIIAKWYAKTVEQDYEQYEELADRLSKILTGKKDILEVAPGPGYLSIELAKRPNFQVTGLDISETFVQIASGKAREKNVAAKFIVGNVSAMPFKAEQFDFVVCRAAFKNFSEPLQAMNEMFRVLRPGGKALIIDMRHDITDEEIAFHVKQMNLGKWDSFFTSWAFKTMLRNRAYSTQQMEKMSTASKFTNYRIDSAPVGFELWLEK